MQDDVNDQLQRLSLRPEGIELPPKEQRNSRGMPSPFSEGNFHPPPKHDSTRAGQHGPAGLKLKTSPNALEPSLFDADGKKVESDKHSNSAAVSPLSTPVAPTPTVPTPTVPTPTVAPPTPSLVSPRQSVSGQAADMQARILALQKSRTRRAPGSATSAANSPTVPSIRRTASTSMAPSSRSVSLKMDLPPRTGSEASIAVQSSNSEPDISPVVQAMGIQANEPKRNSVGLRESIRESMAGAGVGAGVGTPTSAGAPAGPGAAGIGGGMRPRTLSTDSPPVRRVSSPSVGTNSPRPLGTMSPGRSPGKPAFDPSKVISPTAATAAAIGPISLGRASSFRTQQRNSLSARRGLNLDMGGAKSAATSRQGSASGGLSGPPCASSGPGGGASARPGRDSPLQMPMAKGNRGLFRDYRKYVDIETGSLNFNGKACVHAQGIEFSSGEKFDISLDKLEFISELGVGNYGTVQKVLHTPNGVFMAVKEIRLELDEASLRHIIMELDVLHRCETHSIISFYGAFFVEGSVYICMEYMNGGSINKVYEGGIPEKFLKYIVRGVVAGLKELKEDFNIIHRDVKPTNILCSVEGAVKLCDFGVSGNLVASIARTNVGCQAYMAPERITGDRFAAGTDPNEPLTYTAESDIWSLGLSIIEMANGSYPYPADMYMSIFSQLNAIVEEPSPALDPAKYSPEACDFVAKLLCKQPKQRPKYADIVHHPWLAEEDCTPEEFGAFVKSRLGEARQNDVQPSEEEIEQPTVTLPRP